MIKINVIGKILKGDNLNWFIRIQDDAEHTGGYLILISKDPKFTSADGCDYWVENYENLIGFFKESNWKISWNYNERGWV
jgi:hypothetical protein